MRPDHPDTQTLPEPNEIGGITYEDGFDADVVTTAHPLGLRCAR